VALVASWSLLSAPAAAGAGCNAAAGGGPVIAGGNAAASAPAAPPRVSRSSRRAADRRRRSPRTLHARGELACAEDHRVGTLLDADLRSAARMSFAR
jgi:hypothetical protein